MKIPYRKFTVRCDRVGCEERAVLRCGQRHKGLGWGYIDIGDDIVYNLCPKHFNELKELLRTEEDYVEERRDNIDS